MWEDIFGHCHGAEEGNPAHQHQGHVGHLPAFLQQDPRAEGVGRDLHGPVQEEVGHGGAGQAARIEGEAVVHE